MSRAGSRALVRLELDASRWVEFVEAQPDATPLHRPAWAAFLAECYGFGAFALALDGGDRLTAGIPVVEVRNPLGRRRWVSLPFTDECGVLGEQEAELLEAVDRARRDAGVSSHEIRACAAVGQRRPRGVTHRLALGDDVDALARGYRSSVRQGIRAAEREGVAVRRADRAADLTRSFYALHVATRRRLGVPVQRRRYFALLWQHLIEPGHGFVLLAERDGVPLAGAVFLRANGIVLYKYGASDRDQQRLRANNALFHEAISIAVAAGDRFFDWGRTDYEDEGLRRFKASWGSMESELVYTTLGERGGEERAVGRAAGLSREIIRRSPQVVCRLAGALLYRYAA